MALYGGFAGAETALDQCGWAQNPSVLDATGLNSYVVIAADRVRLDGFVLTGGVAPYGAGIYCKYTSPVIGNCIVKEHTGAIRVGDFTYLYTQGAEYLTAAAQTVTLLYESTPPAPCGGAGGRVAGRLHAALIAITHAD